MKPFYHRSLWATLLIFTFPFTTVTYAQTVGDNPANAVQFVPFTAPDDVCINSETLTGLGNYNPTGGVYAGPGVTDDGNGMTYSFNPAAATAGTHTVTYTVPPTTQIGADIDGEAAGDQSGRSVSLSSDGSRVAIGAIGNDGNGANSGQVRLYDWNGSSWVQVGLDIDGEAGNDRSGFSVSLSSDGSRVAIGAVFNAGNGSNSGQVRLYDLIGSSWVQVGQDIDGEAANDQSGSSVSLSSDGSRVAIGAVGNGISSGQVRLYDWNGSSWVQVGLDIDGEAANDQSG
jgi:hypothetical protein